MRSRSPQIALIGTAARAASLARPVAKEALIAPFSSRALRPPSTRWCAPLRRRRSRGRRRACAQGGAAHGRHAQEPVLPAERRAPQQPVDGHELERAGLPGRRGLQPARADEDEARDGVGVAQREPHRERAAERVPADRGRAGAEFAHGPRQPVDRGVEREVAGEVVRVAEAREVERDAARAPGEQRHRGRPVLPRAAEPVQQHERRAGPGLGARHHAAGAADSERAEAGREVRQPGGPRGCARRSGSGPSARARWRGTPAS